MEFNFKKYFLNEMPIDRFNLLGKWGKDDPKRGYNNQDIGILTNPKAVEKIKRKWSKTDFDFDMYFVRDKNAWKYREVGVVTPEFAESQFGIKIDTESDKISIIFTNNIGSEKIQMTSWMIAHRLSHAIKNESVFKYYFSNNIEKFFKELIKDYGLNVEPLILAYNIGTTKSCRERNLLNFGEFIHELFAQYLIEGKIKFKPIENILISTKYNWGRKQDIIKHLNQTDLTEINIYLEQKSHELTYNAYCTLGSCYNKVFLM